MTLHSGVVVVDKPPGITSHTVVAQARRLFARKDVGHAGTLDPMATGVLLVLIGQACKLSGYLTADSKRYAAEVSFGRATDTLDAEGQVLVDEVVPEGALESSKVERALELERARTEQVPPAVSAIKVDGRRAYALARQGETVELAPRAVQVLELALLELEPPRLRCELHVSKGYYVRSLARDLGQHLGLPAHLSGLRRLASGPFRIDQAAAWPRNERPALISMADAACSLLPRCVLTESAVARARQGKRLTEQDFVELPVSHGATDAGAWLAPTGELVAIGTTQGELRVVRGFTPEG